MSAEDHAQTARSSSHVSGLRIEVTAMRLVVTFLGLDLFSVEVRTDADDEDTARDLSGGTLSYDRIEVGGTDRYMGFTNGREVGDDD